MNANIQTITLDLTNSAFSAAQKVSVVQGDSGTRPVKAIITDNGVVRTDLYHESARLYISNAKGERPTYVEGISINGGIAEFSIPQSATLQPGIKNGELRLVDKAEKVLSSMSFMVEVTSSQYDVEALLGTDDGDVLERMVERARTSEEAAADSAEAAQKASQFAVSYSEAQNLTDEQKETARNNIGAVDASLVVSELQSTDAIPNGTALVHFTTNNCVMASTTQNLRDIDKRTARENIGAISQTELDEAVANVGGGGSSEVWETIADITLTETAGHLLVTQDSGGEDFSLKKVKIIFDTDNTSSHYTATGTLMLSCVSEETNVLSRAMYLSNAIPNTAGRYGRAVFEIEVVSGLAFVSGRCSNNLKELANTEFGDSFSFSANLPFSLKNGILNKIQIGTNYSSGFAVGTRLQVLGVRV